MSFRFRWSRDELEKVTDWKLLETLIRERKSTCMLNSPLHRRLRVLEDNHDKNRTLFAVASELLEACKVVVYILKQKAPWARELRSQPWYAKVKIAIAKATKG